MQPRLNPFTAAPHLIKLLTDFGTGVTETGLEPSLMDLVKVRASQINGCAMNLALHTRVARARGETEERLYLLDAWQASPLFNARERAALGWTDALTLVSETHAPDDTYASLKAEFTEEEQVRLTLLIVAVNGFNRLGIGFRLGEAPSPARQAS